MLSYLWNNKSKTTAIPIKLHKLIATILSILRTFAERRGALLVLR